MDSPNPYSPPQAKIEPERLIRASVHLPHASRPRRLIAQLVDTLILTPVSFGIKFLFLPKSAAWTSVFQPSGLPLTTELLCLGLSLVAFVLIHWVFLGTGQTIGKKLLGIHIQSRDGKFLSRANLILKRYLPLPFGAPVFGLVVSPMLAGLLLLADALCIFRKDYNTLHDDLAGTEVVKRP